MKRILAFACLALVASPALAMGTRPVLPPNPVTDAMQQAEAKEFNSVITCAGQKFYDNRADFAALEKANNNAGWGAGEHNLAKFQTNAAIVRTEAVRLKAKYC